LHPAGKTGKFHRPFNNRWPKNGGLKIRQLR
jgi:hypothetical protein